MKRADRKVRDYVTREEVEAILAVFDQKQWLGRRNYALLLTLYNTGARVSEIIALRQNQFSLGSKGQVHLCGKGRKERLVPLWSRTAVVLKSWFAELTLSNMTFAFPLCANIDETFLAARIREQGEKEMNHDEWSKGGFFGSEFAGPGSNCEGKAAQFRCSL
jgi:integrase